MLCFIQSPPKADYTEDRISAQDIQLLLGEDSDAGVGIGVIRLQWGDMGKIIVLVFLIILYGIFWVLIIPKWLINDS